MVKYIYLDQNIWIQLARSYYDKDEGAPHKDIVDMLIQLKEHVKDTFIKKSLHRTL